jgi:hypothetical protein
VTDDVIPEPPAATGDPTAPDPAAPGPGPAPVAVPVRVAKRRGRVPLLAAVGGLVVAGVGAAGLVLVRTGGRDADEAVAAARSAVESATSFRFTYRTTDVLVEGDSDNSTETTTRTTEDGEWAAGVWHVTSADEYSAYETIIDADGTIYNRWSDGGTGIDPEERWDRDELPADLAGPVDMVEAVADMAELADVPVDDGFSRDDLSEAYADEAAVGVAVMVYLSGEGLSPALAHPAAVPFGPGYGPGGDPAGFLDALREYGEPSLDEPGTITTTLRAPDELSDALGRPIPDGEVSLVLGPDDLPVSLHLRVAGERSSSDVELDFTDWNSDFSVEVPGDDAIDPTPWVEEEDLLALDLVPVLPTAVPAGWEPMASAMAAADYYGAGPEGCSVLDVSYDEPLPDDLLEDADAVVDADVADLGYVWTNQTTLDCALALDDTPFVPGGPAGLPHRTTDDLGLEQVLVGDTVVEVDSSLQGAELDALTASLAPTTLDALVALTAEEPADWDL